MTDDRPTVWRMVNDAVKALGGSTTNVAVRDWVQNKYPGTNANTIHCQIMAGSVNHASRVYYNVDARPRVADDPNCDVFFRPEKGRVGLYDPNRHGKWEIYEKSDGRLGVREVDSIIDVGGEDEHGHAFAAENHLRDYLAQHLEEIETGLQLFVNEDVSGVEYITPIGRIDILAVDDRDNLVVIELKVSRGPDSVAGQILRYKNWVKRHLADGRQVRGIIIAQRMTDKIRYAIADDPEIAAKEYEIHLTVRDVEGL